MTSGPIPPPPAGDPPFDYRYEAQSLTGEAMRGTLEASSAADVQSRLTALQLRVLSVSPTETEPAVTRRKPGLALDDFLLFNQQLAHLTAAGLPVESGLRLIASDLHTGRLSSAANAVAAELEKGVPLKAAFAHHASQFPALYSRLIDAGVQSNNLPAMLFNLGRHLEMVSRLRRTLWRTFAYPLAVLLALSLVLLFVSFVIAPSFADIFKDFHTTLPALTELMLYLATIYPQILLGIGILVAMILIMLLLATAAGKLPVLQDTIAMRIPLIGTLMRASAIARWTDALRISVEAGLDLPRAMGLASDASNSLAAARDSAALTAALSSGRPLREVHRDLLPATIPAAIEMASHSGDLPVTLRTLAKMYEHRAEHRLRMLPGILTPALVIMIGCFIGLTVFAMFLPLVKLVQSVSGGD